MDKTYADTVRLLLAVTSAVFAGDIFAIKGGTAINLFIQDMPRLSVDIDVVYRPWQTQRDEALKATNNELAAIPQQVESLGVQARLIRSKDRFPVDNASIWNFIAKMCCRCLNFWSTYRTCKTDSKKPYDYIRRRLYI